MLKYLHMEGQKVGTTSSKAATLSAEGLDLLWPSELVKERAALRRQRPWSPALGIASLILATLIALALGPMQLVLMVITQNYLFVTETYFPVALRISLLLTGLLAVAIIITIIRAWREQPPRSSMTAAAGIGVIIIAAFIWLDAFVLHLSANALTATTIILVIAAWVAIYFTSKRLFSTDRPTSPLAISFAGVFAFALVEVALTGVYLFSQTNTAEESQIALEQLGQAQAAAHIDGITPELSDLVYTLCQGNYDPVYILNGSTDTGLFECRESHEVYSVSGPSEPVNANSSTIIGSAFYFGKTSDPFVANYFPNDTGAKYLYRDLVETENPSELVLLLPAESEEALVNNYLDRFLSLANDPNRNAIILNVFYTNELNTVVSTRDFILIAAVDTISMLSWLPHGMNLQGYLNGRYGAYLYTLDSQLGALNELAANPLVYSSQTRDALNSRRRISILLESGRQYTADELRDLLWASFRDPAT